MEELDNKDYGIVYVMRNEELGIIKIGISRNVWARRTSLACCSGCKITVIYTTKPIKNYAEIERMAHNIFYKQRRPHGEWFDVNEKEVIDYLKWVVDDKQVHPIAKMYLEGVPVLDIAISNNVSRPYISKLLSEWNLIPKEKKIKKKAVPKPVINNLHDRYSGKNNFNRISANLYRHYTDEVFRVSKYQNGKMTDLYFDNIEEAREVLNAK